MKKILAFTLCLVMVLCSAIAVFADTTAADGTVLYSATFDGKTNSPKSLDDAGLVLCKPHSSFKAEINSENGALAVSQASSYSNIGWKNDVVGDVDTYTMQITFRWTNPLTNASAGINPCVGGYDSVNNDRVALNATNIRYNSYREDVTNTSAGVKAGHSMVEYYGHIDETTTAAWMPEANAFDEIPGNWVTVSVEVNAGALGKVTVAVVGLTPVVFDAPQVATEIPDGNPYLRFGNSFGLEIFDLRIVKGIGVNMQTPTLPARPTLQTGTATEADTGNVLYYQKFNKSFNMTDLTATGLQVREGAETLVKIDEDGYLLADNATGKKGYQEMFNLPDVVPEGLSTYTWEMKFRFISSDSHGGVQPSWIDSEGSRVSLFLRYNNNGKFDNVATAEPVSANAVAAWLGDDFGPGGWVTMKVAVKDGFLYSVSVSVLDKYSGQDITWITENPEYTSLIPFDEDLVIRFGSETKAQFESIRLVEGVDYTEYKGDYATKSYSGHEDSAATTDEEEGDVQMPTVNDQAPAQQQKPTKETEAATETESEIETEEVVEEKGCGGFAGSAVAVVGVMSAICGTALIKRKREE